MRSMAPEELQDHNMDVLVHACDAEGSYLGLVPPGEGVLTCLPPPDNVQDWRWGGESEGWTLIQPLADLKSAAKDQIDRAAGSTRLKFITDVPGQQGTYMRKAEEARAFVAANYAGAPPPYIAAEAAATGQTPQEAADGIVQISNLWEVVVGPGIEQIRIGSKRAVDLAVSREEVASILSNALGQLNSF